MDDLISRKHLQITLMGLGIDHVQAKDGRELIQILDDEPSVQPEQKIGQWLGTDEWYHKCSCCGEVFHFYYPEYTTLNKWNFCPRCGTKMESEDKT